MKTNLTFCLIFFLFSICSAQNINRVKRTIDTLTSPYMHGRGATYNGDSLAASFIEGEFDTINLRKFQNFYQEFTYNINTFPGDVMLKTGSKTLVPGVDYILDPSSGSGEKTLKPYYVDTTIYTNLRSAKSLFKKDLTNYAVILGPDFFKVAKLRTPQVLDKIYEAGAIIETTKKKLTASLSPTQAAIPHFIVKFDSYKHTRDNVTLKVDAELKENYTARNVIGAVLGKVKKDSFIVVTAHYDHLGRMGKDVYFPGANDNSSGVSMLLELARHYSDTNNQPDYTMVFMAFAGEEAGLLGSRYYTENPLFDLKKIKFLINLDLMGTGDEGIMAVNGAIHEKEFEKLEKINEEKKYVPVVKKRGKAANSDHYFFSEAGVPAFFLYTMGGISAYHDVDDKAETLPLTKFPEVFALITDFVNSF